MVVPPQPARFCPITSGTSVCGGPVEWANAGIPIRRPEHGSLEMTPGQVTVFVRGPRDTRGSRIQDFEASIDIEGLGPGQFQLPVRVVPPSLDVHVAV